MFFCGGRLLRSVGHDVHSESLQRSRSGRVARLGVGVRCGPGAANPEVVGCSVDGPTGENQAPEDVDVQPLEVVIEAPALEDWISDDKRSGPFAETSDQVVGPGRRDPAEEEGEHWDSAPGGTARGMGFVAIRGRVPPRLHQGTAASEGFPLIFCGDVPTRPLAVAACLIPGHTVDRVIQAVGKLPVALEGLMRRDWGNAGPSRDAGCVLGLGDLCHRAYEFSPRRSDRIAPGWAGEAVVDDPVAVVVEAVAAFGGWGARDCPADLLTVFADGQALDCALTLSGTKAYFPHVRGGVVGHAVAVIVHPVTVLGAGQHFGRTDTPAILAEAHAHSVKACPDASGGRGASVACPIDETVVGDSVAVVVDAVAFLGDGENLIFTGSVPRSVGVAAARTSLAGPDSAGSGWSVVAGAERSRRADAAHAIVDDAIAVVVGAVDTVLVAWGDFPQALGQHSVNAFFRPTVAGTDALAEGRAVVAVYSEAGATVVVFVGLAITVVVEVVTDFGGRRKRRG